MDPVLIHEVGPRDGLQAESATVPTDVKLAWLERLVHSGLDLVQVGSFVHPERVPQMADTDELFRKVSAEPEEGRAVLSGLVLNERGLERGLACGVELFCMGVSASDTHSRRNTSMSTEEATGRILATAQAARAAGRKVQLSIQSAFGCGFEGPVPEARVLRIARAYLQSGFHSISLADTAGHAHPAQVRHYVGHLLDLDPTCEVTAHIHNTYGLGMANVYAAIEAGASAIETSFGGLGGCPFTRVAAGNVATEDLVHGLQRAGLRLDIRLDVLLGIARDVARHFGRELPGCVHKTGPIPAPAAP